LITISQLKPIIKAYIVKQINLLIKIHVFSICLMSIAVQGVV